MNNRGDLSHMNKHDHQKRVCLHEWLHLKAYLNAASLLALTTEHCILGDFVRQSNHFESSIMQHK